MNLSSHFTLAELTKSSTALRLDIDNIPESDEKKNLILLCASILEPVRMHFDKPFVPSSGFRCLELNRAIGSKDTSQHVKGQAVDFEVPGISNIDLFNWIKENVTFDQLILEFHKEGDPHSGWVHCSFNEGNNRNQAFSIG